MIVIKIVMIILIITVLGFHIYYLIKSEEDVKKLKEMVISNIILYILAGKDIIQNLEKYDVHRFLLLISWILFFYIFYFLIYYDYRKVTGPDFKQLTKKEIFDMFRQRASENSRIFMKNKPFVITFFTYLIIKLILLFFK
jgi:hypothetical protein